MVKHRTREQLQNVAPEHRDYALYKELDEKGVQYYALGLYRLGSEKKMYVDCPYSKKKDKKVWIKCCKSCENFLGSTAKMRNHWLCKKVKNENKS